MPQCLQNVCLAVPVLNWYVVSSSLPLRSSNRSGGTIRCRNPFLAQIEQLQSVTRVRSAVTRNRTRPQWHPPSMVLSMVVPSILRSLAKQPELRWIARGLCQPEMTEGVRGQEPTARRALEKTFLDQKRLDDFLDGVARLGERRRDSLDSDRTAAVVLRDRGEVAPVHPIEPGGIDLELDQRAVAGGAVDRRCARDQRKISHPAQQPSGDAWCATRAARDLIRPIGGHADAEQARATVDDLFELALGIKIEPHRNPEAVAQRIGEQPRARGRANQGEPRE